MKESMALWQEACLAYSQCCGFFEVMALRHQPEVKGG